jgi:hypothetical protein
VHAAVAVVLGGGGATGSVPHLGRGRSEAEVPVVGGALGVDDVLG